jgi:hypothetical protein
MALGQWKEGGAGSARLGMLSGRKLQGVPQVRTQALDSQGYYVAKSSLPLQPDYGSQEMMYKTNPI